MICTWGGVIILVLSGKRYCHQIEMISVIKVCLGVALFGLQDVNVLRIFYSV